MWLKVLLGVRSLCLLRVFIMMALDVRAFGSHCFMQFFSAVLIAVWFLGAA